MPAHSPRRESNRPYPGALTLRALLTAAGLLLAIAVPDAALASCKTQLPTPALRSLDASVDSDPALAIRDARARLRPGSSAKDALWNGQLQAVIADAYDTLSDDLQAQRYSPGATA